MVLSQTQSGPWQHSSKMGGLGLRNVELHSPAAFLSSQAAIHEFCTQLDPKHSWDPFDNNTDNYAALNDYNTHI